MIDIIMPVAAANLWNGVVWFDLCDDGPYYLDCGRRAAIYGGDIWKPVIYWGA